VSGYLEVFEVSDPTQPTLVGAADVPGEALRVAALGAYAYVATAGQGLCIYEMFEPSQPALLTCIEMQAEEPGICVSAGEPAPGTAGGSSPVYVADGTDGVEIYDLSDPLQPRLLGTTALPGEAIDILVSGDHAYVTCEDAVERGTLHVVDVSEPATPVVVGDCQTPGPARRMTIDGTHLYLASYDGGMAVVDVTEPEAPRLLGSAAVAGQRIFDVALIDHAVVVADYPHGLTLYPRQCGDPTPVTLSAQVVAHQDGVLIEWTLVGGPWLRLAISRASVVGDRTGAYAVVREETLIGGAQQHGRWLDVDVVPERTYAYTMSATRTDGGVERAGPHRVVAGAVAGVSPALHLAIAPNPATHAASFRYVLPARGPIEIDIYDVVGRRVRRLLAAPAEAGTHVVRWDGRDDRGRRLTSGTYFVRLATGSEVTRTRLLLVR
jgi:hypothetical protein